MDADWQGPTDLPDLRRVGMIALDTETKDGGLIANRGAGWPWGDGYVCGVSIAYRVEGDIRAHYIPLRHPDSQNFDREHVFRWLKDLVASDVRIVTQNGVYDWGWLCSEAGIKMPPSDRLEEIGALATIVDENRYAYGLDALCAWRGLPGKDETLLREVVKAAGFKITKKSPLQSHIWQMPARFVGPYAEADAANTLALFESLAPVLEKEGTRDAYRLEVDLLPMVHEMRRRGIRVDQDGAERARDLLLQKRDAVFAELSEKLGVLVGMEEIGRNKWLAETFNAQGIAYPRTEKGNPSFTAGSTGWMHKHPHWLPPLIVRADRYNNAAMKFLDGYILGHAVNGRIHAEIHPHRSDEGGTRSLRFSYSNPPLQQMTSHDEELAPLIRGVFLPEEGEFWAKPDISQQEFRLIVHYAAAQGLHKAKEAAERYRNDADTDFHQLVSDWTGLERSSAKNTNFAKAFGAGVRKFAAMINKPENEARAIFAKYDRELPFVSQLAARCQSTAAQRGYLELYDGARRHWDSWEAPAVAWGKGTGPCSREEAERRIADPTHPWYRRGIRRAETHKAMNALIQGSAARHTKLWMRACWREGIVPLLQMHDALDCSVVSPGLAERVAQLGREAVTLEVPMQVDLKFGRSWGDAKHTWEELAGGTPAPKPTPKPESAPEPEPAPEPGIELDPEPAPEPGPTPEFEPQLSEPAAEGPKPPPPPKDRPAEKKVPPPLVIELTKITKIDGPLTKRLSLAPDGTLMSDGSACVMSHGTAERVKVTGVADLGALIESLAPTQALVPGSLRADLPDKVDVTAKKNLNGVARPDLIARTGANIVYHGPAFALLDYDTKGMSTAVAAELKRLGGFWPALLTVLPALGDTARVERSSTSSWLSRSDTGAVVPGSDGVHVYIAEKDGTDSERFLKTLHAHCWLAGLGWLMVGASGTPLERSIVDRMVGGPERLMFEGGPVLVPPLVQDKESRRPVAVEGKILDTVAECPPLSIVERARLADLKARERERLAPEMARVRAAFIAAQAKKLVARTGMSEKAAQQVIIRQCEGVLRPEVELPFDDPKLAGCTVGDVLADPERFESETLADPLEGVAYGRCVAKIMRRDDGTPWIHSFAHGRTIYELKLDAAAVRQAMEKGAKEEAVATFALLAAGADIDAVELEDLRQLAKKLSGTGLRAIDAALKSAQQKQAAQDAKAARAHRAARRRDPRPQIRAPFPDEPWLPQMAVLNEVIGSVVEDRPPARDIDGSAMRVRKLPIPDTHAFSSASANEPAGSSLPPPEQWVLSKMSEIEVAEMIERYIDFYVENEEIGDRRSVHMAMPFVGHFMQRDDEALPTVVAIGTAPIVLADGGLLAPEGLDRERGIQFIIQDELRAVIPRPEDCTPERVKEAMKFLCDEWLVDVAADSTSKATIVAAALTLIERSLLDQRPVFFITAGKAGGGKTTTLTMLIKAITGNMPAAAAWSTNEEERRKTLLSYFMYGVPYILWDNIPRGMQLACSHIEKSCTSAYYSDRKLGVSEIVATAASTIHLFTGNNIAAKGDLAARSLHIRLDVDRVDPESRPFRHPDPIGWTEKHRAEILAALYTILLGNPQLKAARDVEGKTRFKMWWRLIGSAVEHAAKLAGDDLDFQKLFLSQKEDDEESVSLAEVLAALSTRWPGVFAAADVASMINNLSPNPDEQSIREFLLPGALSHHVFSAKAISRRLKQHLDEPVKHGKCTLTLRRQHDTHTKMLNYHVVVS